MKPTNAQKPQDTRRRPKSKPTGQTKQANLKLTRAQQALIRVNQLYHPVIPGNGLSSSKVFKPNLAAASAGAQKPTATEPTRFSTETSMPKQKEEARAPKVALGDPNKVGRAINNLNNVKNLRTKDDHARNLGGEKAIKTIMAACEPDKCMSPDACRYSKLLDRPFDAPWGDEGEMPVRPLVYEETVPPTATSVCRQFGQTTVTIKPGFVLNVMGCVGSGNQQSTYYVAGNPAIAVAPDGDPTGVAMINVFDNYPIGDKTYATAVTLGAPNDGRVATGPNSAPGSMLGVGCFGFFEQQPIGNAPGATTGNLGSSIQTEPLYWGSQPPFGDMNAGDSAAYKYRPIAGGLMVTPVDAELEVGGSIDCEVIATATNDAFVESVNNQYGSANNISQVWALPDHKIVRGDNQFSVNWLPSRLDYGFKRTQPCVSVGPSGNSLVATWNPNITSGSQSAASLAAVVTNTDSNFEQINIARNARVVTTVTPPQDEKSHSYVLSYVGFYEVAGACVQQTAIVPRPQPTLGAKVATAVQDSLQQEVDDRTSQVSKGAAFEVMRDHPQIGPMIEKSKDLNSAKSTLTEILDFGKSILPLAEALLL